MGVIPCKHSQAIVAKDAFHRTSADEDCMKMSRANKSSGMAACNGRPATIALHNIIIDKMGARAALAQQYLGCPFDPHRKPNLPKRHPKMRTRTTGKLHEEFILDATHS